MGLKGNYGVLDNSFDVNKLHAGDAAFRVVGFREKTGKGKPIIELDLELVWSPNEEDQEHIGKTMPYAIFFANGAPLFRQLGQFARDSGCRTGDWTANNNMPESLMIPGFLKYLAYQAAIIKVGLKWGKDGPGSVLFLNWGKVLYSHPETGEALPGAPEEGHISHEAILEAVDAEVPGEKAGSGGSDTPF